MRRLWLALLFIAAWAAPPCAFAQETALKALGRLEGWRENALVGYGVVVGLSGSGDSPRSAVTRQALANVYGRLGAVVSEEDINSRNAAVVVVMAALPASANVGDRISVTVSSTGDARSLAGGVLLMTPLLGPDGQPYALAQGSLVAGGDSFSSQLNLNQRNYPTTARIEGGATIERPVNSHLVGADGRLGFLLFEPSFTTSSRIAEAINAHFGRPLASAVNADEVRIAFDPTSGELAPFVATLENLRIEPDRLQRVVINERSGTVVAGGDVMISSVVVSQGDIRVTITSEQTASHPGFLYGFASELRSLVITNTALEVDRGGDDIVVRFPSSSVADLVQGLSRAGVDTRRIISILQAVRAAGALHADIIVQ
ncbi:MAG TPA: flagellar basal body P-ring protein FlgI [Vitreimonas sp.]|uniref:flagellar basal body P-ring protein FlgI n=1 Tax=Vitreimonas sp. TaxID=3069702 RepID=UPI002D3AF055|nr:flagellar basal body P-ring protein FlgI [Vitreimonas sp.]HYD85983.1 flagellar basal body P-ring protein FlgI [Vitreimonas sp.]